MRMYAKGPTFCSQDSWMLDRMICLRFLNLAAALGAYSDLDPDSSGRIRDLDSHDALDESNSLWMGAEVRGMNHTTAT